MRFLFWRRLIQMMRTGIVFGALIPQVNAATPQNREALLLSLVKEGEIVKVTDLIAEGTDVNCKNQFGNSAIHIAVWAGNLEMVSTLISLGANVNFSDESRAVRPPLASAIDYNLVEIADRLIHGGASVNRRSDSGADQLRGDAPLMWAVSQYVLYKDPRIVTLLLDAGANPNDGYRERTDDYRTQHGIGWNGYSVLAFAAEQGHPELVRLLIRYGAAPELTREDGATALELALKNGHAKTAEILRQAITRKHPEHLESN